MVADLVWGGFAFGQEGCFWGGTAPEETLRKIMNSTHIVFSFPIGKLFDAALRIIGAGGTYPAIKARLDANFVEDTETQRVAALALYTAQKDQIGDLATMTATQSQAFETLNTLFGKGRKSARRAFAGQDTKLNQEFGIGTSDGRSHAITVAHATQFAASAALPANAAALATQGWKATETAKLAAAIETAKAAGLVQGNQKGTKKGGTAGLYVGVNTLYDRLRTIQNAADLEWPENAPANVPAREAFLLGTFPPAPPKAAAKPTPTPTPPPTPTPAT